MERPRPHRMVGERAARDGVPTGVRTHSPMVVRADYDSGVVASIRAVAVAVLAASLVAAIPQAARADDSNAALPARADVGATLDRLGEIAVAHADAGADLLIPSGMLDGSVTALRLALARDHGDVPVAAMAKLESSLYSLHRVLVQSTPIRERAVPLLASDDPSASLARAQRDVAEGADAVVVKPGAPALDIVAALRPIVRRPLISFHTADEHAAFVAAAEELDGPAAERETLAAARRAGADLVITYGAWSAAE